MTTSTHFSPAIDKLSGPENIKTWQFVVSLLILLIKPINYVHIQTCTTAKDIWNKFKATLNSSRIHG